MSYNQIKKAIKEDKLKALKKLVEKYPIIVNLENSDAETPLYIAVHEENIDIAKYLMILMLDEKLRLKMGAAGRERVVENFDYRVVAKKFVQIINDKLGIY